MGGRVISHAVIAPNVPSAVSVLTPAGVAFDPAAWHRLLEALPPCACERTPRIRVAELHQVIAAGVVRHDDIRPGPHECGDAFMLADGRFIFHPPVANSLTPTPPLVLPSPRFVATMMVGATVAIKSDFKSFFFQLTLPPVALSAFRFVAAGDDGEAIRFAMARTPMGWSASPAGADSVARFLADVPLGSRWEDPATADGVVYIDDILFRCRRKADAFKARVAAAGGELKFFTATLWGVVSYIGIELAIPGGAFRPSRSLAAKARTAVEAAESGGVRGLSVPQIVGIIVAFIERAGVALANASAFIDLTRRWDASDMPGGRIPWSPRLASEADWLRALASDTAWRTVVSPPNIVFGASDASSSGWGWVWYTHPTPSWGGGTFDSSSLHINHLELVSVLRAVRNAPPHSQLRLWVDNRCVVEWIRKGLSRTRFASSLLVKIEALLHSQGSTLVAAFIPTSSNPADSLSRGGATPSDWPLPPWTEVWQRRVLGWSVPSPAPPAAACNAACADDAMPWEASEYDQLDVSEPDEPADADSDAVPL